MNFNKFATGSFAGKTASALALAAAVAISSGTLLAAPPAGPSAYQPTGTSSAPRGEGLASLDDRAVAAELSSRGIVNLLDYYFKANNISEADQAIIKNSGALRELLNPSVVIPYGEKLRRVRQVAEGINTMLATMKDPVQIMDTATIILKFGVESDVNNIEYWGEDPVTQAQLKPMTSAVIKLYETAAKTARAQADDLEKILKGGNDPNGDRWQKLDDLSHMAEYNRQMSVYFDCLATSQKDPARKAEAEKAITALKDYDNNDSTIRAKICNMLAKLQMVAGDFATAEKTFESVYSDKTEIKPAPNPFEQYEARYFDVVAEILQKNLPEAQKDKAALDNWQKAALPGLLQGLNLKPEVITEQLKGISAAGQMLQWRVHVLEGDLAKPGTPQKDAADKAAEQVLLKLRDERPDLAPRIDQQLVNRMPANKKIDDSMPPSLLLALLKRGVNESYKTDSDKPDPAIINKGIEAAMAIIHRTKREGLSDQNVSDAMLALATLQERSGKKIDAIGTYLDFASGYFKLDPKKAIGCLDRAGYLIFDLKKLEVPPTGFEGVYNRFLPIAIQAPYNHTELAYLYAEQLRGLGGAENLKQALKFYRLVPPNNPVYLTGIYRQMLVLDELRDTKQTPEEHAQTIAELTRAAEDVRKFSGTPKDDSERMHLIRATFTLADLAREQKDPKRMLAILQGVDAMIDGLSDGKTAEEKSQRADQKASLKRTALVTQINANIGAGQINQAVQQVQQLLLQAKGNEGISLVRELLGKLDEEFTRASVAHEKPAMRDTARNEASLTHFLVDWSNPQTQKDPNVSKFYYAYALYDARTQRLAGSLTEDPAEQKKLLEQALKRYHELDIKPLKDLFLSQPEIAKRIKDGAMDPSESDPQVAVGLALTEYDLGLFKEARDHLDVLLANRKLGTPDATVVDPKSGETTLKPNDLYWEATLKYIRSAWEVAKTDPKLQPVVIRSLKNILIRGGIPDRWADDFKEVQKELVPDFDPNAVPARPATTAPAAPPAATPKK